MADRAMASRHWRSSVNSYTLTLLCANVLIVVSLVVFALGFFPYKAFLPAHASFTAAQAQLAQHAPFDKVVFMVVDALRRSDTIPSPIELLWLSGTVISSFRITQASSLLRSMCAV